MTDIYEVFLSFSLSLFPFRSFSFCFLFLSSFFLYLFLFLSAFSFLLYFSFVLFFSFFRFLFSFLHLTSMRFLPSLLFSSSSIFFPFLSLFFPISLFSVKKQIPSFTLAKTHCPFPARNLFRFFFFFFLPHFLLFLRCPCLLPALYTRAQLLNPHNTHKAKREKLAVRKKEEILPDMGRYFFFSQNAFFSFSFDIF